MQLPEDFIRETKQLMGAERFSRYMEAFDEEAPVSIRLNPQTLGDQTLGDGSSCLTRCAVSGNSQTEKNRPRVFDGRLIIGNRRESCDDYPPATRLGIFLSNMTNAPTSLMQPCPSCNRNTS